MQLLENREVTTKLANFLEKVKDDILSEWIERDVVTERLKNHSIEPPFFIQYFGSKILEYFIGVCKGEKEAGECPAVGVMLDFFKDKSIPLNDIFRICANLKNTIIASLFKNYKSKIDIDLIELVNYIFDNNFEGVICEYLNCSNVKSEKQTKLNLEKVKFAFEELQELLLDSNSSVKESFYLLELELKEHAKELNKLKEAIDIYDFDKALVELYKVADRYEVNLRRE